MTLASHHRRAESAAKTEGVIADVQAKIDAFSAESRKVSEENERLRERVAAQEHALAGLTEQHAVSSIIDHPLDNELTHDL
jgi:hypothetical protein